MPWHHRAMFQPHGPVLGIQAWPTSRSTDWVASPPKPRRVVGTCPFRRPKWSEEVEMFVWCIYIFIVYVYIRGYMWVVGYSSTSVCFCGRDFYRKMIRARLDVLFLMMFLKVRWVWRGSVLKIAAILRHNLIDVCKKCIFLGWGWRSAWMGWGFKAFRKGLAKTFTGDLLCYSMRSIRICSSLLLNWRFFSYD